jgi:branched-chain amino acid transport system permease protein
MFQDLLFGIMLVGILQYSREGVWPLVSFWLPASAARKIDPAADVEVAVRPPSAAAGPLLALDKARKTFGGLVAVDDVSFTVGEAETVALIGPNGAGKSTLFDLMTGVRRATAGRVLFDGEPIERLAPQAIARRGIARTFQHVRLVPELSVIENVTLGAHSHGKAGVMSAILRLDRAEERRLFAHAARRLERVGLAKEMFRPPAIFRSARCAWSRSRVRFVSTRGFCCSMSRQPDCVRLRSRRSPSCCVSSRAKESASWWSSTTSIS